MSETRQSVVRSFAQRLGMDEEKALQILINTVLKANDRPATKEEAGAFMVVANELGLNPFRKGEIWAFVDQQTGGIVPVLSIDSWIKIANNHPLYDGMTIDMPPRDEWVKIGAHGKLCPPWITIITHVKGRTHSIPYTEWLDECFPASGGKYRDKRTGEWRERDMSRSPWHTHPRRMLQWRATSNSIRLNLGTGPAASPDEAEDLIAGGGYIDGEIADDPNALVHQRQQQTMPPQQSLPTNLQQASVVDFPRQEIAQREAQTLDIDAVHNQDFPRQQPRQAEVAPPPPEPVRQAPPPEAPSQPRASALAEALVGQVTQSTSVDWLRETHEMLADHPLLSGPEKAVIRRIIDGRITQMEQQTDKDEKDEKPRRTRRSKADKDDKDDKDDKAPSRQEKPATTTQTPQEIGGWKQEQEQGQEPPAPTRRRDQSNMAERHKATVLAFDHCKTIAEATALFNKALSARNEYTEDGFRQVKDKFLAVRKALGYQEEEASAHAPMTPKEGDRLANPGEVYDRESDSWVTGLDALKVELSTCRNAAQIGFVVKNMAPDGHRYSLPDAEIRRAVNLIRDRFLGEAGGKLADWNALESGMQLP